MVKEMISGPLLSDEAARLTITMLTDVAVEIGQERFHAAILKAIETCERRPTVATMRRLAGVSPVLDERAQAVVSAWSLVTDVVQRHVARDQHGNAYLAPFIAWSEGGGYHVEQPVPEIPECVRRVVVNLGGWGALAESYPVWWSQKFMLFKELFQFSPADRAALISPKSTDLAMK